MLAPQVTRRVPARLPAAAPAAAPPANLDERDVLACLGRGLSDAEIAAELVISEATTKTHVWRVLARLGLRSRVPAAIVARSADPAD